MTATLNLALLGFDIFIGTVAVIAFLYYSRKLSEGYIRNGMYAVAFLAFLFVLSGISAMIGELTRIEALTIYDLVAHVLRIAASLVLIYLAISARRFGKEFGFN